MRCIEKAMNANRRIMSVYAEVALLVPLPPTLPALTHSDCRA